MGDDDNTYLICPYTTLREQSVCKHTLVRAKDADEALYIYLEERNELASGAGQEYWVVDVSRLPIFRVAMKMTTTRIR